MSGGETETEISSLADAEQAKWMGRKEEYTQTPCNVDTGDIALTGVQCSAIQLYLTAFAITASLVTRAKCPDAGHPHTCRLPSKYQCITALVLIDRAATQHEDGCSSWDNSKPLSPTHLFC